MSNYHITQEQALEIWNKIPVHLTWDERAQDFANAVLDQVLGEPVAYQTPLRYGSKVTHNKPVKPDDWDDDFIKWYSKPLYAPKEQS